MFAASHRRLLARSALVGLLLAVATAALLAYHVHWAHKRRAFLAREQAAWVAKGATRRYIISEEESRPALFLRLVGERGYDAVFFAVDVTTITAFTDVELNRVDEIRRLFPEARVHTVYLDNDVEGGIRLVSVDLSLDETSEFTRVVDDLRNGRW